MSETLALAADLWGRGYNSLQIARALQQRESCIYNHLTEIRRVAYLINDEFTKSGANQ